MRSIADFTTDFIVIFDGQSDNIYLSACGILGCSACHMGYLQHTMQGVWRAGDLCYSIIMERPVLEIGLIISP